MANDTTGETKDNTEALMPSGNENYDPLESERAKYDLVRRALQYAKDCGATVQWPPPGELEGILQSEFWFFIF